MPEIKFWIIAILIVFAWAQYTYPDKVKAIGDSTFGKLNDYAKVKTVEKVQEKVEDKCSDEYEPVCSPNGVTYDNLCKAIVAGEFKTTSGECII